MLRFTELSVMPEGIMNWKQYQEKVSSIFRAAGCDAEVDKVAEGVREKHKIDVYVKFKQYGIECIWVIECKYWNTNVPKEKVLALQSIVDDIGADRGVIVSKSGFQSGTIRAAVKTNITLTSLEELEEYIQDEVNERAIKQLELKVLTLKRRYFGLQKVEEIGHYSLRSKFPDNIDAKKGMEIFGRVFVLEIGFEAVKIGEKRIPYSFDESGNHMMFVNSEGAFIEKAEEVVEFAESWLNEQIKKIKA